jgi:hypothetical protein
MDGQFLFAGFARPVDRGEIGRTSAANGRVGIKQVSELPWLVGFMDYGLGYFDHQTWRLEPIENPFGPKVLPMPPE